MWLVLVRGTTNRQSLSHRKTYFTGFFQYPSLFLKNNNSCNSPTCSNCFPSSLFSFTIKLLKWVMPQLLFIVLQFLLPCNLHIWNQSQSLQLHTHDVSWISYFTNLELHTKSFVSHKVSHIGFIILINILPKFEMSRNFDFFILHSSKCYMVSRPINSFYEIFVVCAHVPFLTTMILST